MTTRPAVTDQTARRPGQSGPLALPPPGATTLTGSRAGRAGPDRGEPESSDDGSGWGTASVIGGGTPPGTVDAPRWASGNAGHAQASIRAVMSWPDPVLSGHPPGSLQVLAAGAGHDHGDEGE